MWAISCSAWARVLLDITWFGFGSGLGPCDLLNMPKMGEYARREARS